METRDTVYTLVCVLHLVQSGLLDIRQDTMFGEVFIFLMRPKQEQPG